MLKLEEETRFGITGYWHDWSDAVELDDHTIKDYVERALRGCRKHINEGTFPAVGYVCSGDTLVLAMTWRSGDGVDIRVMKNRLSVMVPAQANQCDGCQAGVPVDMKGLHYMGTNGYSDPMACQANRYK